MDAKLEIINSYSENFKKLENKINGETENSIHLLRKKNFEILSNLNFPTTKDEEWKYTNISPLLNSSYDLPLKINDEIPEQSIEKYFFSKSDYSTLVFINGIFSEKYSCLQKLPDGAVVSSLSYALKNNPELILDKLNFISKNDNNIFSVIGKTFLQDGIFISINDNIILEKPIQIVFVNSSNESFNSNPTNLFLVGKNSQIKIVESFVGLSDSKYFTNSNSYFFCGENSNVEQIKIQNENLYAFHISNLNVELEKLSSFKSYNINFGGSIVRNNICVDFNDEHATCTLNGLSILQDEQLIDNHTNIMHSKPNCSSNQLYKSILADKSRGVFNGKILVKKDAQKTNAFQENKNILLSDNALINTKPQLEIFADDVKCSHGATIGQLDKTALFYLRSRGISETEAKHILIYAFASDVVHSISIKEIRDYLEKLLLEKLINEKIS